MGTEDVLVIHGGEVITPEETLPGGCVVIRGSTIAAVGRGEKVAVPKGARHVSARGKKVMPGLIETHTHGLCGNGCLDGTDALVHIRRNMPRFGVTGFLPTLFSAEACDNLRQHLDQVKAASRVACDGAQILGVHLEGPFFNTEYGMFPELSTKLPSDGVQERIIREAKGFVKIVTLSPELKGALGFIRKLKANRIVAAIGHSGADEQQFRSAVEAGASHVIHLFNAMRRRSHQEGGCEWPGLSDLILDEDRLTVELIVDGIHVKPALLKLAMRMKGVGRIILITDSTTAAGMKPGRYILAYGKEVVSDGTSCRTPEGGLAGSLLTLNRGVGNMSRLADVPLAQAVQMATWNPARLIGAHRRKGGLEPGKDADICIADDDMQVAMTIVKGRVVYCG